MTNSTGENNSQDKQSNSDNRSNFEKRLSDLNEKLSEAKSKNEPDVTLDNKNAYSYAFRIASELIAGPVVGAFIGYWLDRLFGTQPIFLIVLLFLGFAAGMVNIFRTAQEMQRKNLEHSNRDNDIS